MARMSVSFDFICGFLILVSDQMVHLRIYFNQRLRRCRRLAFSERGVFITSKMSGDWMLEMGRRIIVLIWAMFAMAGCSSYNQANASDKIDAAVTATLYQLYTTYPSADSLAQNA